VSFFGKYYFNTSKHLAGEAEEASVQDWMRLHGATALPETWQPPTDLYEVEGGLVLLMDVPGVEAENLRIQVEGRRLTVRGVRGEKQARCKRTYRILEIHHGPFERAIDLPCAIDASRVRGRLSEGTLELVLPPAAAPAPTGVCLIQVEWHVYGS